LSEKNESQKRERGGGNDQNAQFIPLYFFQDENNFLYPLLQVGSASGYKKYRIRQAINGSDRIRILIPGKIPLKFRAIAFFLGKFWQNKDKK